MNQKITFRTEIEFVGSTAEFEKVAAALIELPIRIRVDWPPEHTAGCWPLPPFRLLSKKIIDRVTEGMPRIIIKDIAGGIRDPHLHIGDEAVFLDRERFKELVGQVAMNVAGKIAKGEEYTVPYTETVGAIGNLMEGVSP